MKAQTWITVAAMTLTLVAFQNCAPVTALKETMPLAGKTDAPIVGEEQIFTETLGSDLHPQLSSEVLEFQGGEEELETVQQELATKEVHKRRCVFHLEGSRGARWFTERYTRWEDSCSSEQPKVAANNPQARIVKVETNFVADQVPFDIHKTKCTFTFRGQAGNIWISERYRVSDGVCNGSELVKVRVNNPKATVIKITTNYVNDSIDLASKNKCTFVMQGEKGNLWFSERYVGADQTCDIELPKVRANNPKATIKSITQNFVFDPYF